jgi:hypothetical protein
MTRRSDRVVGADLLIVGSGSLARAVCDSVAVFGDTGVTVHVIAGDLAKAEEIAQLAAARVALARRAVTFRASRADLADGGQLAEVLWAVDPRIVVQCASLHSPYEGQVARSAWTDLVARAGFGITAPLQARLVLETARAIDRSRSRPLLINACFPDVVNPMLDRLGLPVLCGLGNVATLSAALAAGLGVAGAARLRVLGHHVHLHAPEEPADEALAWVDDLPVTDVGKLLAGLRAADRAHRNDVAGFAAGPLLADLLAGRPVTANLPGPLGLPGGYPVLIEAGRAALDLPPGLTEAEAVAFNERAGLRDGIRIEADSVRYPAAAARELNRYAPELAGGFALRDVVTATERLVELRDRLRRCTATT